MVLPGGFHKTCGQMFGQAAAQNQQEPNLQAGAAEDFRNLSIYIYIYMAYFLGAIGYTIKYDWMIYHPSVSQYHA